MWANNVHLAARYARHLVESGQIGQVYHVYGSYLSGFGRFSQVPLVWRHEYRTYLNANHIGNSLPPRVIEALKFLVKALRPEVDVVADQFSAGVIRGYKERGIQPPE
jgi:hypothetical protein